MADIVDEEASEVERAAEARPITPIYKGPGPNFLTQLMRLAVSLAVPLIAFGILYWAGTVLLDEDAPGTDVVTKTGATSDSAAAG